MKKNILLFTMIFAIQFAFSQDYLISFTGSIASNDIDSISVENLNKETTAMLFPGDSLQLIGVTGVLINSIARSPMEVYPNPMTNSSVISFFVKDAGNVSVTISNIAGHHVVQLSGILSQGIHKCLVSDLKKGSYIVNAIGKNFNYSSKLISQNQLQNIPRLIYMDENNSFQGLKNGKAIDQSKSIINMDYTPGDILLFKAYAGNYCTFLTDSPTEDKTINFEFVECVDFDGNHYPVVQVGDQLWMAECLKTTHYRDGTPIPNITDNTEWAQLETGAYCWYDNDISHKAVYGALYNWYTAIDTNNIAPMGWHVPTKEEIITLTDAPPGGYSNNGGKLKETGNEHWIDPNVGATNEYGFTALPGGYRSNASGIFQELGLVSYTSWSSTEDWGQVSWYTAIDGWYDRVYLYGYYRKCGFSIRCIKD